MTRGHLDETGRDRLARLAEVVVPRTDRMPSAMDVGLSAPGGCLDKAIALRPDLARRVLAVMGEAEDEPDACLDRLGATSAADLFAVLELIAGAYYLVPQVQDRIGYHGQQALDLGRGEIGGEDMLEAMMARPPRWRRPPASGKGRAS